MGACTCAVGGICHACVGKREWLQGLGSHPSSRGHMLPACKQARVAARCGCGHDRMKGLMLT